MGAEDGTLLIESAAERNERERAQDQRRDRRYRTVQLWFNGILMLATILTAGTVLYQNRILNGSLDETKIQSIAALVAADAAKSAAIETKRSADIANESFVFLRKVVERPYLVIESMTPVNFAEGQAPTFILQMKNTGKNPALNVVINVTLGLRPGKLEDPRILTLRERSNCHQ